MRWASGSVAASSGRPPDGEPRSALTTPRGFRPGFFRAGGLSTPFGDEVGAARRPVTDNRMCQVGQVSSKRTKGTCVCLTLGCWHAPERAPSRPAVPVTVTLPAANQN